jgi:hypothetical protein
MSKYYKMISPVANKSIFKILILINYLIQFKYTFFFFGATAPILSLAYLHETLRFTSVL